MVGGIQQLIGAIKHGGNQQQMVMYMFLLRDLSVQMVEVIHRREHSTALTSTDGGNLWDHAGDSGVHESQEVYYSIQYSTTAIRIHSHLA